MFKVEKDPRGYLATIISSDINIDIGMVRFLTFTGDRGAHITQIDRISECNDSFISHSGAEALI